MNKFYPAFLAAALLLFQTQASAQFRPGYSELSDSETVTSLKSHVRTLSSADMEGRKAGSEGERAAADYIRSVMKGYGVEMLCPEEGDVFGISRDPSDTLVSRNIVGFVQGYDKKLYDHYIVIGARMDNLGVNHLKIDGEDAEQIYYGANGNASGAAMLLELSRMVSTNAVLFRRSVIFVAFGASCDSFAGSWYFLNRSFSDVKNIDAMINLDMLGTGDYSFEAYTSSNADMNSILEKVSGSLQKVTPKLTSEEPYPSDHRSFYAAGIPSVMFTTGRYPEHDTPRDTDDIIAYPDMEDELEYIYNFTKALCNEGNAPEFSPSSEGGGKKIENGLYAWSECDQKPTFLGHSDPKFFLQKWVYQYMKYPVEAEKAGIQGRVTVEFTIDKKGKVKDARVTRSVDPLLDAEALKVINASPDWKPGKVKGVRVDSYISLPIEFRLEKRSEHRFGIKK